MDEILKYNSYELRDIKLGEYIHSYKQVKGITPSHFKILLIAELTIKEIDLKIKELDKYRDK